MNESRVRARLRAAIGEVDVPPTLAQHVRTALERSAASGRPRYEWLYTAAAVLLCIAIVAGLLEVNQLRRAPSPVIPPPPSNCAASSLIITGIKGERLHPALLPPGFVLESGDERDLGAENFLEYSAAGVGDQPYIELERKFTTLGLSSLLGGSEHAATVQGRPAVVAIAPTMGPPGTSFIDVDCSPVDGVVLTVAGHNISESEVIDVADNVEYDPGTAFRYPSAPRVTVSRGQAVSMVARGGSSSHAVMSSFGEVDAVVHKGGGINRLPTLPIEVIRPVWVVWSREAGIVVDAVTGARLMNLAGVDPNALSSLSDRSLGLCQPPFGILTRTEVEYLLPVIPGTQRTIKLMTAGTLIASQTASSVGNCRLLTCDPSTPLWVIATTAPDSRLLLRPCWAPAGPCPSAPTGSWTVGTVDARTGPQHTGFSKIGAGGRGPLPPDIATLPDLDPTT